MPEYLIAQDSEEASVLRVDYSKRFIQNASTEWQFLFNSNSFLTPNVLILKNAGQFNTANFNQIKLAAYLYNSSNGTISAASSCTFSVYGVSVTSWTETLLGTFTGTILPNNYYISNINLSSLNINLDGEGSIMVECVLTRLSETFRDRIYLNHLGIYDSVVRLRKDVDFLDLTKMDE
jgi:hypothetical protein